ncbi:MAG TPA: NifU family protein [Candidatus Dormibacteraeota bacterium]|nr:NifU family protein [Candidatus Dormibacteraeota bacterium]
MPGERLESLVQEIDSLPAGRARDTAVEIVQELMDLHGSGLERMLELIHESKEGGQPMIERLAADPEVSGLLLLHDLHPAPLEERVMKALASVRPYLETHGGNVELLRLGDDGVAHLRLEGSCHGCASSAVTLELAIEQALNEAAPDLSGIEVEGVVENKPRAMPPGFIPLQAVGPRPNGAKPNGVHAAPSAPSWQPLSGLTGMEDGELRTVDVAGTETIVCRLGPSLLAYENRCPGCAFPLGDALIDGTTLTCPHCSRRFDLVHAGRAVDDPSLHLQPLPILHDVGGEARIAIPALAR